MNNFTSGPWEAQKALHPNKEGDWEIRVRAGEMVLIAHAYDDEIYNTDRDVEANARLIASAPEMFDAIKAAMRIADLWVPSGEIEDEYLEEYKALNNMSDLFDEVLAKIEGEE